MTRSIFIVALALAFPLGSAWGQDQTGKQVVVVAGNTMRVQPGAKQYRKVFIHDESIARIVVTDGEGWLIEGVAEGKTAITFSGQHPQSETRELIVGPIPLRFVLLKNNSHKLKMASQKPVQKVVIGSEGIVSREPAETNRVVVLRGLAEGTTRVTLRDGDGNVESFLVQVQSNQLHLTVGSTIRLQLTTKEPIAQVINEKDLVARVSPLSGDPTTVLLTGLAPGITRITLIGADGRSETRESGKK